MATFDISPLFRSGSLGLDSALNQLNTAMHLDPAGFPAYNILRTGDEEFRISLAVPGFTEEELTIETRNGSVWVKGEHRIDQQHNQYLFRGIDAQNFQRSFQLPEHVKVSRARLEAGLLHIDLYRELPEALQPHRVKIETDADAGELLQDKSRAA